MSAESEHEANAPLSSAPAALTRATVYAGATATEYVRAGCGAPVLLLAERGADPLLTALGARFRVIAPELPCRVVTPEPGTSAPPFSVWLRDFLDGLGIARVDVVATEAYGVRALSYCLVDPARVGRIALLFRDASDPTAGGGSPEPLGRSGHRLLVRRETDEDGSGAIADVLAFLTDGACGAP